MSARNNKLPELTDIPLNIENQEDSIEITAPTADKMKSNSLKRFFRTARNSMTTSKSLESADAVCESEMKNVRSLQLRFGSFHKKDENPQSIIQPSSSVDVLKSQSSENQLNLPGRIANYWSKAFKKSSKNSFENVQLQDKATLPPSDINKPENNQSEKL